MFALLVIEQTIALMVEGKIHEQIHHAEIAAIGQNQPMADIKLFRIGNQSIQQLEGRSVELEKSLQDLMEEHLETMLGVRLLASEHSTGPVHGGRIDTLGLDENGCPVIIEYKRSTNENVINQGLFYMDWLLDHRGDFELLVHKHLGPSAADAIEWSSPRLLCIAGDFTKYDEHAVKQINRNIELIRYRHFPKGDLLLLEMVHAVTPTATNTTTGRGTSKSSNNTSSPTAYKTFSEHLAGASQKLIDLHASVDAYLLALGDDVTFKMLKCYGAYRRLKNFACIEVRTNKDNVLLYCNVPPKSFQMEPGFTRDMTGIGHYGTGDLEITIGNMEDFDKAKPILLSAYEIN